MRAKIEIAFMFELVTNPLLRAYAPGPPEVGDNDTHWEPLVTLEGSERGVERVSHNGEDVTSLIEAPRTWEALHRLFFDYADEPKIISLER